MSHLTEQDLYQLLEGTVTDQQRAAIEAHLSECADCREWAGESAEVLETLQPEQPLQHAPRAASVSRIADSAASGPRAASSDGARLAAGRWVALVVAAAALASILILRPFQDPVASDAEIWATIASANTAPAEIPVRVRAATGTGSLPSVTEQERFFWLGAAVTDLERLRRTADPKPVIDRVQTIRQLLDGSIETQPIVGLYEALQQAAEQGTLAEPESAELNLQADQMLRNKIGNPHYELGRELEWLRLQLSSDLLPSAASITDSDAFSEVVREQIELLASGSNSADPEILSKAIEIIRADYGG